MIFPNRKKSSAISFGKTEILLFHLVRFLRIEQRLNIFGEFLTIPNLVVLQSGNTGPTARCPVEP